MSDTMIKKCKCRHLFQDKQYGPGMRVHNQAKNRSTNAYTDWVCTVCENRKGK